MQLLASLLGKIVTKGHLRIVDHRGRVSDLGETDKPALTVRLADAGTARALLFNPQLAFGETYMDGRLKVEGGDIADLLDLLTRNLDMGFGGGYLEWINKARVAVRRLMQRNNFKRARKNVAHHYDLEGGLYDLFLDSDKQYSCAFYEHPGDSLDKAQLNKRRRITAKLDLKPGQRVLDIGCGWGGLGLHMAQSAPVDVTGVTLSEEQLKIAQERARRQGVAERVRFRLEDYRNTQGPFERIVSVGMFEHVGIAHYDEYFRQVARLLTDDGVALIHAIGRSDGPGVTNPWIAKYIFPGGYTPALSEVMPPIEKSGLMVTDVEILRLHYAHTLAEWRRRFRANWDRAARLHDERFCRMWEFYLAGAEMGFRNQGLMVFQIQIAKRVDALPIVRDYMIPEAEPEAVKRQHVMS
ncbi:MAG TPA: cyclopropane-fatty-acyl-phospholipid synthase family protein [Rhizomicrobium sp.]|nr:cyclopropane-fatty-acyl-phospholipid synthase family protein [Rhizomicrobium sp.]